MGRPGPKGEKVQVLMSFTCRKSKCISYFNAFSEDKKLLCCNLIFQLDVDYHLQGEQGDDGKIEGPPGPQGDIVSHR